MLPQNIFICMYAWVLLSQPRNIMSIKPIRSFLINFVILTFSCSFFFCVLVNRLNVNWFHYLTFQLIVQSFGIIWFQFINWFIWFICFIRRNPISVIQSWHLFQYIHFIWLKTVNILKSEISIVWISMDCGDGVLAQCC